MPITDAQGALLRAALLRDDGLLPRPDRLAGAALIRIAAALTGTGFAKSVPVHAEQPRWREIDGVPTGLRITAAGRGAVDAQPASEAEVARTDEALPASDADETASEPDADAPTAPSAPRQHRPGSKAARLVAMLSAAEGASIDALATTLAWQPHTVRAALTRLRQRGSAVTVTRAAGQPTTYRIVPAQLAAAPADGAEVS